MTTIEDLVDKIFIINLDSRVDKWDGIKNHLKNLNITNYERFSGIVPTMELIESDENKMRTYQYLKNNRGHNYAIGALGCLLSHISVIQIAKNRGYKKILILEDDARFFDDHQKIFDNAIKQLEGKSYDMLYLSTYHKIPGKKISKNVLKMVRGYTTVSYIISDSLYDDVINMASKSRKEIDVFYSKKIHPNYNCLSVHPVIIYQNSGISDILGKKVNYPKRR